MNIDNFIEGKIWQEKRKYLGQESLTRKIEEVNKKINDKKAIITALEEQKSQLESELKEAKLEELSTILKPKAGQ